MSYNLTLTQEKTLEWLVQKTRSGELAENEVLYTYSAAGGSAVQSDRDNVELPDFITKGVFDVLHREGLANVRVTSKGSFNVTLTGRAYEAVDSDFEHEEADASTSTMGSEDSIDVFISHSNQDSDVAETLIELLESALDLPSDSIRCTSVDGYRLPAGASTDESLRHEVHNSKVLIGLITPNSMESPYVLFELGARWGTDKSMFPILAKGAEHEILGGPLKGLNVLNGNREAELHQFVEDIASKLGLEVGESSRYRKYISHFVDHGT
jgi:hypothetical protein